MKLLVATDLSPRSDRAIARGYALAAELQAELTLLYVVDSNLPKELRDHSLDWARKALAKEIAAATADTGIKAQADVLVGDVKADIARHAATIKTDIILIGVHNATAEPKARSFAATTAGRILKSTRLPVLLAKSEVRGPYATVVIGVDFSVYSRAALRTGVKIARGAHFNLVHAFHVPFKGFMPSAETAAEVALDERLAFDAFLAEEMDLLAQRGREAGLDSGRLTKILREDEPRHLLPAECDRLGADLLVIGTQGRTGVSAAIWGSVASDLLDRPPTDVLVVKAF